MYFNIWYNHCLLCYKLTDLNPAMVDSNIDYSDCYGDVMIFCGEGVTENTRGYP